MVVAIVVGAVLVALVGGAWVGAWFRPEGFIVGFLVALAAGALITALVLELTENAIADAGIVPALAALTGGAIFFTAVDYWIDERSSLPEGWGLAAAAIFDGLPENLALGVTLIGAGLGEVSALATAIVLSNFPEAAAGARNIADDAGKTQAMAVWTGTAAVLGAATVVGYLTLSGADPVLLGGLEAMAAGAIIASLATELLPKAYDGARHWTGIAITVGFVITLALHHLT